MTSNEVTSAPVTDDRPASSVKYQDGGAGRAFLIYKGSAVW